MREFKLGHDDEPYEVSTQHYFDFKSFLDIIYTSYYLSSYSRES